MPDLTERLAAKLEAEGFVQFDAVLIGHKAATILPLLLSEPELVASLPPEAKREVLTTLLREQLEAIADPRGYVYLGTLNSGARRLSKVDRVMELLLNPEVVDV